MDLLIAAHALALDAAVVTNNVAHFARVPGLRTVNWLTPERGGCSS
jgi:tRNA(fMet)-specific endonuclease VapC